MSESTAVEAPAAKEPFFKMSSIPGANILVPLLLGCLLNTLFPDLFKTLGSFTLGMTQQGAGPLVGAFLLIVGTTISFKSAPAAAARGAIIIAVKQIVVVAVSLLILYVFNDNLFGISAMVMLAACTGANNAMYAGLMGTMGNEAERGAVAITTLVVGPPVTMIVLGAAGQAPIGWSLVGAILPIVVGIILGNLLCHGLDHDFWPAYQRRSSRHPARRDLLGDLCNSRHRGRQAHGRHGCRRCGHFELRRSQCGYACCHGKRQRGHVRWRRARDGYGTGCCLRNRDGYIDPAGHQLVLQAF